MTPHDNDNMRTLIRELVGVADSSPVRTKITDAITCGDINWL